MYLCIYLCKHVCGTYVCLCVRIYICIYVLYCCRCVHMYVCVCAFIYYVCMYVCKYIQGVPGGKYLTSGECSLGQTIPI